MVDNLETKYYNINGFYRRNYGIRHISRKINILSSVGIIMTVMDLSGE